jgi:AcrR family transcriptional regulator
MSKPLANGRLPRGRHHLPTEFVEHNQRRRLLDAAAEALAVHGYTALTVAKIIEAASVSRATFYAHFTDKRDCVLVAHRAAFGRLMAETTRACEDEREWPHRLRSAVGALFAFAAAEPARVHLLTLYALGADSGMVAQLASCNVHLATLLREGRRHTVYGPRLPDLTEEALVGAVGAVLGERLSRASEEGFGDLEREVIQLLLTPYVGVAEAVRVASGG